MTTIRRLMAVAVGATAALVMSATPASADEEITVCFPVGEFGGVEIWDCYTVVIPELVQPPWPPGCPACSPAIDLWDGLDVKAQLEYLSRLGEGMGLLSQAANTADPGEAKQLRGQATESFLTAAESLGGAQVKLERVGWADLDNNELIEDPAPSLEAAGGHLVEGLGLMQKALGDPDPQPNLEAAMAEFDASYENLAALYAG